jgi:hypothetical protein
MKPVRLLPLAALLLLGACATRASAQAPAPPPPAPPRPNPNTASLASAGLPRAGVFEPERGPMTPALKALVGRVPLVHLTRKNLRRTNDPAYEVAIFDDGTMMYEGSRCVHLGGLVLRRLDPPELTALKELLSTSCVPRARTSADEVCPERGGLSVTCSGSESVISSTDRCMGATTTEGAGLQAFADEIMERTGVAAFIGAPTERLACDALSGDMATGEIGRTLTAKAAPFAVGPPAEVPVP